MRDALRRIHRATIVVLLLVAAAGVGGCSWIMWIARVASIEGVDAARIDAALAGDPNARVKLVRVAGDLRELVDDAGRTVEVSVRGDQIRVSVTWASFQPQPTLTEVAARVEYVCAMLDAACPEIGEWDEDDETGGPRNFILRALACFAACVALITWLIVRTVRRANGRRSPGPPIRAP